MRVLLCLALAFLFLLSLAPVTMPAIVSWTPRSSKVACCWEPRTRSAAGPKQWQICSWQPKSLGVVQFVTEPVQQPAVQVSSVQVASRKGPDTRVVKGKCMNVSVKQREIALALQQRRLWANEAIQWLTSHHFNKWEGGGSIHDVYVDAHLLRGSRMLREKKYASGLADFQAALEYPDNLEVGKPTTDRKAFRTYYFMADAYEKMGNVQMAAEYFRKAVSGDAYEDESRYYQGMAYIKIEQEDKANDIFDDLIQRGKGRLAGGTSEDFFAKFGQKQSRMRREASAHYIMALGYMGKGQYERAANELLETVKLNPDHVWAVEMKDRLGEM